jgi:oxygen-independent coproporphyrinogen-3 oxidase
VFLGGGTPTILEPTDLERMFRALRESFQVAPGAEITVECAPGTLTPAMLDALIRCGVNRVSLGVQSWVDSEAAAVGRLHTRARALEDVAALRTAGIQNINVDLIAGLPHQTAESWAYSISATIACGAPHASIYMLEVDQDSRLGRELMAGGKKYHAHFVPEEDLSADYYAEACVRLEGAGIRQYEISNFARPGSESRHNLKYWERKPYFGFGVDAHSMMPSVLPDLAAVRLAGADDLNSYIAGAPFEVTEVPHEAAMEEAFFLGLRLNRGVDLSDVAAEFGESAVEAATGVIDELAEYALLERVDHRVRLTAQGRLLSNEVFEKFLGLAAVRSSRS